MKLLNVAVVELKVSRFLLLAVKIEVEHLKLCLIFDGGCFSVQVDHQRNSAIVFPCAVSNLVHNCILSVIIECVSLREAKQLIVMDNTILYLCAIQLMRLSGHHA